MRFDFHLRQVPCDLWYWSLFVMTPYTGLCCFLYAPLTPGGDYWMTGRNSANHHWSLVVAPSPCLVTNVWSTVSKRHGNEKVFSFPPTISTVSRLSGIVETQLRHSRVGVAWLICKKRNYALFTAGGDRRATGHDSANRHWSLVVASSPRLVANVRHTLSKRHGNPKIIFISTTKWTVARLSGIVETQLRHSRVGVARLICKKTHYSSVTECCECTQLCLNYLPSVGQQMEKWWVLETVGRQITMTLPQHLN